MCLTFKRLSEKILTELRLFRRYAGRFRWLHTNSQHRLKLKSWDASENLLRLRRRRDSRDADSLEAKMAKQPNFWSYEERLAEISADGDPLELWRRWLISSGSARSSKGGGEARERQGPPPGLRRPAGVQDACLQSRHGLSLEATGKAVRDRPCWMRFCGLGLADRVPTRTRFGTSARRRSRRASWMPCPRSLSG